MAIVKVKFRRAPEQFELEIDTSKLSARGKRLAIEYGLRQMLLDTGAAAPPTQVVAMALAKLATLTKG